MSEQIVTDSGNTLFVVATPIGHRDDLSQRAIDVLQRCCCIYAEDTRHSRPLLQHHGIGTPLSSLHEHNEANKVEQVVQQLRESGSVALISDAGTPLISDPGYRLVRACQDAGFTVSPIPGPSAVTAALSVAGLATNRFLFAGFPPAKPKARQKWLEELAALPSTVVLYESPHRVLATLATIADVFGETRELTLAREMTKRYETIKRGTVKDVLNFVQRDEQQQRGEFVLVLAGANDLEIASTMDTDLTRIMPILLQHVSVKTAARVAAEITGESRKKAYEIGVRISNPKTQ